jgi:hypothetical protein
MRFMAIVKGTKDSEAGVLPSKELLAAMGKFNEEMVEARGPARRRGIATEFQGREGEIFWSEAHRG